MSENNIINSLEFCMSTFYECDKCTYRGNGCSKSLSNDAINLILRQKGEIERYKDYYDTIESDIYSFRKDQAEVKFLKNKIKCEAIIEFAEQFTKKIFPLGYSYDGNYSVNAKAVNTVIDNLVKEMTEEKK